MCDSRSYTEDVIVSFKKYTRVGTAKKSAAIIIEENEDKLWAAGTLNFAHSQGLQKAVFFCVGVVCCLRGGETGKFLSFNKLMTLSTMFTPNMSQRTELVATFCFMLTCTIRKYQYLRILVLVSVILYPSLTCTTVNFRRRPKKLTFLL